MISFDILKEARRWNTIYPQDGDGEFEVLKKYIGSPIYAKDNNGFGSWIALLMPSNEQKEAIKNKIYKNLCSRVVKYAGVLNKSLYSAKNLNDIDFIKKHKKTPEFVFKATAYLNSTDKISVSNFDVIQMAKFEAYLFDQYYKDDKSYSLGYYRKHNRYIACVPVEDIFFLEGKNIHSMCKNIISIDDLEDVPVFGIGDIEKCIPISHVHIDGHFHTFCEYGYESFYVYNIGLCAYGFENDNITYSLKIDYVDQESPLYKSDMFIKYGVEKTERNIFKMT